jgi:hypothetical protein
LWWALACLGLGRERVGEFAGGAPAFGKGFGRARKRESNFSHRHFRWGRFWLEVRSDVSRL